MNCGNNDKLIALGLAVLTGAYVGRLIGRPEQSKKRNFITNYMSDYMTRYGKDIIDPIAFIGIISFGMIILPSSLIAGVGLPCILLTRLNNQLNG